MSYPNPPGQQPPYGTPPSGTPPYGTPPYGGHQVADPGAPPPPVRAAWILELVLVGSALLGGALLPLTRSYVETTMRESLRRVPSAPAAALDPHQVAVILGFVTALIVFFIAIRVALWVWLAIMVRQGRSWARIVVTVIAGLGLAGLAVSAVVLAARALSATATMGFVRPSPALYRPTLLSDAVYVALLVLLWRPEASRWFAARTAWRRQQATRRGSPAGPAW